MDARQFERQRLHIIYRSVLRDYRAPTSEWMRQFSRNVLEGVWENYRAEWDKERAAMLNNRRTA